MKKTYIITAAAVAAAALLILFFVLCARSCKPESEEVHHYKHLNETLDNSHSEIEELKGLDKEISRYLRKWNMRGASLAVMRNDSLLYAKGYGWADKGMRVEMNAGHILRMASVSKLITAVGIMKLQDDGRLSIKDKVFGDKGILNGLQVGKVGADAGDGGMGMLFLQLLHGPVGGFLAAGSDDNSGTLLQEFVCSGIADAPAAAGDDGNFIL